MPSPDSSQGSIDEALALAKNLGVRTLTLPIAQFIDAFDATLRPAFEGYTPDVTEENLRPADAGPVPGPVSSPP